jgi:hypothetical protein
MGDSWTIKSYTLDEIYSTIKHQRIQFLNHVWLRVGHVNLRLLVLRLVTLCLSLSLSPLAASSRRRSYRMFLNRTKNRKKDTNKIGENSHGPA